MKKSIILSMVMALIVLMSTSVFAASSLADELYAKGKDYGVTTEYKARMDKYFANNEITEAQKASVLAKADECIAIMDKAGVKDVLELSTADLNKVKSLVQSAANDIGLTVKFHSKDNGFTVLKGDKTIDVVLLRKTNKLVYTGSNTLVLVIASLGFVAVAGMAVARLRK